MELLAAGDGHADDEVAGDAAQEDQRVQDAEEHLRVLPASLRFISTPLREVTGIERGNELHNYSSSVAISIRITLLSCQ